MSGPHRFWRVASALAAAGAATALLSPPASEAAAPTPILTKSVVLARTAGAVAYERPGTASFVALASAPVLVPVGTAVDAAVGVVRVTIARATAGTTASALFYAGRFSIAQKPTGMVTLTLNGPLAPCPPSGATGATGATKGRLAHTTKRRQPPKTRSLWGDGGGGSFTTEGHFAAATVVGTVWLTTDSCTSTVVSVAEGDISVRNIVTGNTVAVSGGQALTVHSTGTTSTAPFTGPTSPPSYPHTAPTGTSGPSSATHALTITSNHSSVALGEDYALTATGTAAAGATAYIYENVGAACSTSLAAERANSVAIKFTSKTLSAAGPFTVTAQALAQHTGTKYYCAYLTDPAGYAQVIVTVGSSSHASAPVHATSGNGVVTLSSTLSAPTLGTPYKLTLTGRAGGSGTAYIYENAGTARCATTLSGEQRTSAAYMFTSKGVTTGSFTVTASALAAHTGTKYYCGYLTDPASEVQIVVTVSS